MIGVAEIPRYTRNDNLCNIEIPVHGLIAEVWKALCRSAVPQLQVLSGSEVSSPWLPAGRYPEWDVMTCTSDRRISLVAEVKWSSKPIEEVVLEKIVRGMFARPVPAHFPRQPQYAIYTPKSASGKPVTRSGVRVVEPDAVRNMIGVSNRRHCRDAAIRQSITAKAGKIESDKPE